MGRDIGQLQEWWLPRLCDLLGESLEASVGRGWGWSVVDSIRGSHNRHIARGGCPTSAGLGRVSTGDVTCGDPSTSDIGGETDVYWAVLIFLNDYWRISQAHRTIA